MGDGKDGIVEVAVGRVWNDADNLAELTPARRNYPFEGVTNGVSTVEESPHECLVHDGFAGERISGVEVSTILQSLRPNHRLARPVQSLDHYSWE